MYEIKNGSAYFQGNQYEVVVTNKSKAPLLTQEQLATQLGISVDTLQNYKMLADMIPELEDLLDTGIVTKTTALAMRECILKYNNTVPVVKFLPPESSKYAPYMVYDVFLYNPKLSPGV